MKHKSALAKVLLISLLLLSIILTSQTTGSNAVYAKGGNPHKLPRSTPTPTPTLSPTPTPMQTPTPTPMTSPNPISTSTTFGITTLGSLVNGFSTDKDASRFPLGVTGNVQSITVYFGTSGFNAKTAVYSDQNGAPGSLITQSSSQYVSSSGWNTFPVPQTTLAVGNYWLTVVSDSPASFGSMTPASANTHAFEFTTYSGEFTSSFGTPTGYEATATSIYATYSTALSSTTPSPISTFATIGIYYDQACTNPVPSISWGTLSPGASQNQVLYIRNEGNTAVTLFKSTSNFNPSSFSNYLALNWDYANQSLSPGSVQKVTLTLTISSAITSIASYSLDTTITATG